MRTIFILAILGTLAVASAQVSRESAIRSMNNSAGFLSPVDREHRTKAMMSTDSQLIALLLKGDPQMTSPVCAEIERRNKPKLTDEAVRVLPKLGEDRAFRVLSMLQSIGGQTAIRSINGAVSHKIPSVRTLAAQISAEWGNKAARPILLDGLKQLDDNCVWGLRVVGQRSDIPVVRRFREKIKHFDGPFGKRASDKSLLVLGFLGDSSALGEIRKVVDSQRWDQKMERSAFLALSKARDLKDRRRFATGLATADLYLNQSAIEAMAASGRKEFSDLLRSYKPDAYFRTHAGRNAGCLQRYAKHVADCLERGIKPISLDRYRRQGPFSSPPPSPIP